MFTNDEVTVLNIANLMDAVMSDDQQMCYAVWGLLYTHYAGYRTGGWSPTVHARVTVLLGVQI